MTRAEHRTKCIEAMYEGAWNEVNGHISSTEDWCRAFTAAFDALHDIARVDPIKATEEMLHVASNYFSDPLTAYEVIARAGDLTNPPEQKP